MTVSYRKSFQTDEMATNYETHVYAEGSYGQLVWRIERDFLEDFIDMFPGASSANYLDFACGSARVLSFMEQFVGHARGIDIANPMLKFAREKVKKADIVCRDISADDVIEDKYDLITAFRFFQNAEPELRRTIMKRLALRLKNEDSRLIFNVHGIVPSRKFATWAIKNAVSMLSGRRPDYNFVTKGMIRDLISSAGLEIVGTHSYDMLGGPALKFMSFDGLLNFERRYSDTSLANILGGHCLYTVRLKPA
jgi:SAM-dependent methyltransferase